MITKSRNFAWCFCGKIFTSFNWIPRRFSTQINWSKLVYNMNTVYLRHKPNEPQFQINFTYENTDLGMNRAFNFSRNITENVQSSLDRIRANLEKEITKHCRKKLNIKKRSREEIAAADVLEVPKVSVQLLKDELPVDQTISMSSLFEQYKSLTLQLLDQNYSIAYNFPWIDSVALPTSILAGCYVYPTKIETHCCEKLDFQWYKGLDSAKNKSKNVEENIEWTKIAEGLLYSVQNSDVGHRIKVICTPKNGTLVGPSMEAISQCLVSASPGPCPFENRQMYTAKQLSERQFRVVSYNILADLYSDSDYSRTVLFPYCPPYALAYDYRKQLIIREIFGYHSDLICLQEVDSKVYQMDLEPLLKIMGYAGTFQQKGASGEGLATFFNSTRFSLIERYGITIGENIPKLTIFSDLWEQIQRNEKLSERIVNRSTAIQVTVMRSNDTNKILIVANTHLYFHPDADHIRLLQMAMNMKYVEFVYAETKAKHNLNDEDVSIIFCGDFNSVPECGIYRLMTQKLVNEDFIDFRSNLEEVVTGITLRQPFDFKSAYNPLCDLKYSNFTPLFSALIDYIFYKPENIKVIQVIPPPTVEELEAFTAIPSIVAPSDHIALIADLEWI